MDSLTGDKDGYWGKPTSTLDWCEENYVVSPYIAEFWNTISNIVMIIPPLVCAIYCWRIGLEMRFIILNLALLVVGVGSWLFHMTLKYEMQLLDELPMIYGTTVLIYIVHNSSALKGKDEILQDLFLPATYCLIVSVAYITMRNPVIHQAFYGALVFLLIYKCVEACRQQPKITPYVTISFLLYLVGFILWNIDNQLCSSLRQLRQSRPDTIKPLMQLHAWWHLFSGMASLFQIVFSAYARAMYHKQECSIKMLAKCLPYLELHTKP